MGARTGACRSSPFQFRLKRSHHLIFQITPARSLSPDLNQEREKERENMVGRWFLPVSDSTKRMLNDSNNLRVVKREREGKKK